MNLWPQPVQQLLQPEVPSHKDNDLLPAKPVLDTDLRKDVLIGHLLRLVAGGREGNMAPLPSHALPAVASELWRADLIPRYISAKHLDLTN